MESKRTCRLIHDGYAALSLWCLCLHNNDSTSTLCWCICPAQCTSLTKLNILQWFPHFTKDPKRYINSQVHLPICIIQDNNVIHDQLAIEQISCSDISPRTRNVNLLWQLKVQFNGKLKINWFQPLGTMNVCKIQWQLRFVILEQSGGPKAKTAIPADTLPLKLNSNWEKQRSCHSKHLTAKKKKKKKSLGDIWESLRQTHVAPLPPPLL